MRSPGRAGRVPRVMITSAFRVSYVNIPSLLISGDETAWKQRTQHHNTDLAQRHINKQSTVKYTVLAPHEDSLCRGNPDPASDLTADEQTHLSASRLTVCTFSLTGSSSRSSCAWRRCSACTVRRSAAGALEAPSCCSFSAIQSSASSHVRPNSSTLHALQTYTFGSKDHPYVSYFEGPQISYLEAPSRLFSFCCFSLSKRSHCCLSCCFLAVALAACPCLASTNSSAAASMCSRRLEAAERSVTNF